MKRRERIVLLDTNMMMIAVRRRRLPLDVFDL
jgi:hypothetical protein